jgi:hypothetical protein
MRMGLTTGASGSFASLRMTSAVGPPRCSVILRSEATKDLDAHGFRDLRIGILRFAQDDIGESAAVPAVPQ